jgi:hypothetical protein
VDDTYDDPTLIVKYKNLNYPLVDYKEKRHKLIIRLLQTYCRKILNNKLDNDPGFINRKNNVLEYLKDHKNRKEICDVIIKYGEEICFMLCQDYRDYKDISRTISYETIIKVAEQFHNSEIITSKDDIIDFWQLQKKMIMSIKEFNGLWLTNRGFDIYYDNIMHRVEFTGIIKECVKSNEMREEVLKIYIHSYLTQVSLNNLSLDIFKDNEPDERRHYKMRIINELSNSGKRYVLAFRETIKILRDYLIKFHFNVYALKYFDKYTAQALDRSRVYNNNPDSVMKYIAKLREYYSVIIQSEHNYYTAYDQAATYLYRRTLVAERKNQKLCNMLHNIRECGKWFHRNKYYNVVTKIFDHRYYCIKGVSDIIIGYANGHNYTETVN